MLKSILPAGVVALGLTLSVSGIAGAQAMQKPGAMATMQPSGAMGTMQSPGAMKSMSATANGHPPNANCTSASNFVVWLVPSTMTYYRKGQASFGQGPGRYVCRREAIAKKARLGGNGMTTGGSMTTGGTMGAPSPAPMRSASSTSR